jgi:hypothetical protein
MELGAQINDETFLFIHLDPHQALILREIQQLAKCLEAVGAGEQFEGDVPEFVASLPKTEATLRVQKAKLRQHPLNENTWDRENAGVNLPK